MSSVAIKVDFTIPLTPKEMERWAEQVSELLYHKGDGLPLYEDSTAPIKKIEILEKI